MSKTAEPIFAKSSIRCRIDCNKKAKLLVSELFRGWEGGLRGHFRFGTSFTNATWRQKWIYLPKKETV